MSWGVFSTSCFRKKKQKTKNQIQKNWNSFKMKSPPLIHRKALILCFDCIFTNNWNSLNLSNHSPLDIIVLTHVFFKKSSTKVTKCFVPPMDTFLIGPQTPNQQSPRILLLASLHRCLLLPMIVLFILRARFANQCRGGVAHLSMRNACNTMGTRGIPKWCPRVVLPLVRGPKWS